MGCPQNCILHKYIKIGKVVMLPNAKNSTEIDRRTWLHVCETHQAVGIQMETSTKMDALFRKLVELIRMGNMRV